MLINETQIGSERGRNISLNGWHTPSDLSPANQETVHLKTEPAVKIDNTGSTTTPKSEYAQANQNTPQPQTNSTQNNSGQQNDTATTTEPSPGIFERLIKNIFGGGKLDISSILSFLFPNNNSTSDNQSSNSPHTETTQSQQPNYQNNNAENTQTQNKNQSTGNQSGGILQSLFAGDNNALLGIISQLLPTLLKGGLGNLFGNKRKTNPDIGKTIKLDNYKKIN
jgi:predicted lipid-binding transport protein (Tim44 family)